MLMPMRMRRYAGGYHELSPTVRDLWAVLADFSRDDRAAFLKFVTSCSKPPLLGFAHLHPSFTVQCVAADGTEVPSVLAFFGMGRKETSRLPTASTCFNLLKLPNFKSRKVREHERRRRRRPLQTHRGVRSHLPSPRGMHSQVLKEKLLLAIRSGAGFELS